MDGIVRWKTATPYVGIDVNPRSAVGFAILVQMFNGEEVWFSNYTPARTSTLAPVCSYDLGLALFAIPGCPRLMIRFIMGLKIVISLLSSSLALFGRR